MIPQPNHIALYELPAGSTLGKYEILRKLATGGMAELYIARVRGVAGFEKIVVLKRILPNVAADEAVVQMFLDEARLAATLQHPNIADVYDVGEVDGSPFFTMEYVHGQDVRSIRGAARKRNEPIPLAISLAIIHGTAAALDYAHERTRPDGQPLELVHRDVSASNIIVSYDGAIKLLDFGIARAASHRHKTQVGTLKGKTPYMSPEQCRAQRLDRRSDLFSLGTVLFELTVGRRPFRGDSDFAIMEQIVRGAAPRPSELRPGYPEQLEAIVMKLLARRPADRYQTAEELLHDLEPFIAQHGLWVSSKPLGKYMRSLFGERIAAWERAAHRGVTLGEHVAEAITSESQRVELVTPPSAFPVVPRYSQEFPAMAMPPAELAAAELAAVEAAEEPTAVTAATAGLRPEPRTAVTPPPVAVPFAEPPAEPVAEVPQLRSWHGRRVLFVLAVAAVLVAGGLFAWSRLAPHEPGGGAQAAPAAIQPAAKPAAEPADVTAEPPKTTPSALPAPPTAGEPAEPAEPPATASEPPAPAKTVSPTPPAAAPKRVPPPRPAKLPAKKPDQPKDQEWDPNSPYLPN